MKNGIETGRASGGRYGSVSYPLTTSPLKHPSAFKGGCHTRWTRYCSHSRFPESSFFQLLKAPDLLGELLDPSRRPHSRAGELLFFSEQAQSRQSLVPASPPATAGKERLEQDEPWHFLPGEEALGGCSLGQDGLPPDWSRLLEAPFAELPSKILVRHRDLSPGGSLVCKNNSLGSRVWDLQACCPSVRQGQLPQRASRGTSREQRHVELRAHVLLQ